MSQVDERILKEIVEMGFDRVQARHALSIRGNNQEAAIDYLLNPTDPAQSQAIVPFAPADESNEPKNDNVGNAAQSQVGTSTNAENFEPLNPEQRQREPGVPVGIKNIGETWYLNPLVQIYFRIPTIYQTLMQSETNQRPSELPSGKVVGSLRHLFASLQCNNRKYADPSHVFAACKEANIPIDPVDFPTFQMQLLQQISLGLKSWNEQSAIQIIKHFIGSFQTKAIYQGPDHKPAWIRDRADHSAIQLQLDSRNLLSAWDDAFFRQIPDFSLPTGQKVAAFQTTRISAPPSVLFFSIQRIVQGVKFHSNFTFPKEIYIDRFLRKNKQLTDSLRKKVRSLKDRVKELEGVLEQYDNYQQKETGVVNVLDQALAFLSDQMESQKPCNTVVDGVRLFSPESVVSLNQSDRSEVNKVHDVIVRMRETAAYDTTAMRDELIQCSKEIEEIFNVPELKKTLYQLHGILIHEGRSAEGSYFTYIYEGGLWRKYSDIYVTVVEEDEVFRYSFGGYGGCSAIGVAYCSAADQAPEGITLRAYATNFQNAQVKDAYTEMIPQALAREMVESNEELTREVSEFQISSQIRNIQALYAERFNVVNTNAMSARGQTELTNTNLRHELINLAVFICKDWYKRDLAKWHVLDLCIREVIGRGIEDIGRQDPVYDRIRDQVLRAQDTPQALLLSQYDKRQLTEVLDTYTETVRDAEILTYFLTKCNTQNYEPAFQAIMFHQNRKRNGRNDYQRFSQEVKDSFILRLSSEFTRAMYASDIETTVKLGNLIVNVLQFFQNKSDRICKQTVQNLQYAFHWANTSIPQLLTPEARSEFDRIVGTCRDFVKVIPSGDLQLPNDLEELMLQLNDQNYNVWVEGWRQEALASRYQREIITYKRTNRTWIDMTKSLTIRQTLVSDAERVKHEATEGIIPPNQIIENKTL